MPIETEVTDHSFLRRKLSHSHRFLQCSRGRCRCCRPADMSRVAVTLGLVARRRVLEPAVALPGAGRAVCPVCAGRIVIALLATVGRALGLHTAFDEVGPVVVLLAEERRRVAAVYTCLTVHVRWPCRSSGLRSRRPYRSTSPRIIPFGRLRDNRWTRDLSILRSCWRRCTLLEYVCIPCIKHTLAAVRESIPVRVHARAHLLCTCGRTAELELVFATLLFDLC